MLILLIFCFSVTLFLFHKIHNILKVYNYKSPDYLVKWNVISRVVCHRSPSAPWTVRRRRAPVPLTTSAATRRSNTSTTARTHRNTWAGERFAFAVLNQAISAKVTLNWISVYYNSSCFVIYISVHPVLYLYFCRRQISSSLWRIHSTLSRSPASLQHPARRSIGMMWPGTRTLTS